MNDAEVCTSQWSLVNQFNGGFARRVMFLCVDTPALVIGAGCDGTARDKTKCTDRTDILLACERLRFLHRFRLP